MDDLINRQAALDCFHDWIDKHGDVHTADEMPEYEAIEKLPSAQPMRKKGKWNYKNDLKQFFCSECEFPSLTYDDRYIYSMDLPNYCEDCGADMRGEQDEID